MILLYMCGNIPYVCVFCVQSNVVHQRMDPLQVYKITQILATLDMIHAMYNL